MIKSLKGYVLHCLELVPPRFIRLRHLLVTYLLHSDRYMVKSDYNLSLCGLCQHITGLPSFSTMFTYLTIDLRPLGPTTLKVHRLYWKSIYYCLDLRRLFPTQSLLSKSSIWDNSNDITMAYSSKAPAFVTSRPIQGLQTPTLLLHVESASCLSPFVNCLAEIRCMCFKAPFNFGTMQ